MPAFALSLLLMTCHQASERRLVMAQAVLYRRSLHDGRHRTNDYFPRMTRNCRKKGRSGWHVCWRNGLVPFLRTGWIT